MIIISLVIECEDLWVVVFQYYLSFLSIECDNVFVNKSAKLLFDFTF